MLVPIGLCLMWFLRPKTSSYGAYFQKQAFRLDETTIFDVFENSQTNSTWHVLMWFLRPLTPYSGAYFQKQAFRLDENTIFGVCENSQNIQPDMFWFLCWSQQRFEFFQEPLRIWMFRYNASTTWTHIVSLTGASSNAHGLCVSKPCELARNLSKTSKTGPTFVCNVGNTTKHLRSFRCKILYLMNYTLYRDTTAFCGKLPSSVSIRANDAGTGDPVQAATDKHVLPPQVHMNIITCPTPPHPTPPMCTKHHGLLKAVVQLI